MTLQRYCGLMFALVFCGGVSAANNNPAGMDVRGDPRQQEPAAQDTGEQRTTADVLREAGLTFGSSAPTETPVSPWDDNLNQQLLLALGDDDVPQAVQLIRQGADANGDMTGDGMTPLMISRSAAMISGLLGNEADPNRMDDAGATALHHLVSAEAAAEMLPLLIAAGADVNAVAEGMNEETPLLSGRQLFFEGGDPDHGERIIRMLHRAGAAVDAQDADGYTALITAAVNDKRRLAQLMIFLGAEPHVRSNDGMTALAWARELGHAEIEAMLLESGARQ